MNKEKQIISDGHQNQAPKKTNCTVLGLLFGMIFGVAIGTATGNTGAGIGIGMVLGLAFGAALDRRNKQADA
jgi:hypothetical protein